jgi:glyoxylase-like metal-dependent hydrolase (beta-lactamase superfamily II)
VLQWSIGDVKVVRVVELLPSAPASQLFLEATPESLQPHRSWLYPSFIDERDNLRMSIHAFVIESQGRRILIDTCVGNGKSRSYPGMAHLCTPFLEHLNEAGYPVDSIDTVLCTHLHFDHVGWNTTFNGDRWLPSFPRARYLFARGEWEYWRDEVARGDATMLDCTTVMADSIRPVIDAGLVDLIETDHRLTDEIWLEPTPGHTPGHVAVRVSSEGQEAVITGDLVHTPLQFAEPTWTMGADADPVMAVATRKEFVRRYASTNTLILGTHFAPPTGGHIVTGGASGCYFDTRLRARQETK